MKYSDEQLKEAVEKSLSVAQVLRHLGYDRYGGGHHSHITSRIRRAGIDTNHFTGQGWNKNGRSHNRLSAHEILVKRSYGQRAKAIQLRRALKEIRGRLACEECGNEGSWMGKKLCLHIHHKNGDWLDDRNENLATLCPNCHAVV